MMCIVRRLFARRGSHRFVLSLFAALWTAQAGATVIVVFVDRIHYTDIGPLSRSATVMREFERHVQHLGDRYLSPDQTLTLEVLDVDLAGRHPAFGRADEVRV